ncbi:unnamed protein product [Bursaphelenchus xylophilus]|uniref:(pine wood nematode) hypothetical protein n=1 Tax=Bursaphelenchus xylophilus TaxID=6326 RepID=A0A1I7SSM4_BURXY|nr:unnamed protein product [Bursaphelenchus xylophilus]CAG9097402.1 unnamed protein product [Bursaphelenchus xylophilus]
MLLTFLLTLFPVFEADHVRSEWDLDGPCQIHVQNLARAQARMVECSTNFSSPPKVCTNCIDEYVRFKQMEYDTHHLINVTSLDNKTCSEIFYGNYLLSYSNEISNALTGRIWDASRCESCLNIEWDFAHKNSSITYDSKTILFEKVLVAWRRCVENFASDNSTICAECEKEFTELFSYYWKIYKEPGIDFCADVESTMNDTMNIWHTVWQCPDEKKDIKHDMTIVAISAAVLFVIISLFYVGSYVQIERAERNYIRYSRIQTPRGQRSRLLSSSTAEGSHTPSSSLHG